jgi:dihydroneopterin aldolase
MACDIARIARTDQLKEAFDYAAISRRVIEFAQKEQFVLIETMAERLARLILKEFGVKSMTLRLRKIAPPIEPIMAYSAVEIHREV